MTLNETQMNVLAPYEKKFYSAIRADYATNPGPAAMRAIHAVMVEAVGWSEPVPSSCTHCQMRLLREAAKHYFETLGFLKVIRHFAGNTEAERYIAKVQGLNYVRSTTKYVIPGGKYAVLVTPTLGVFGRDQMEELLGRGKNYA